MNSPAVCTVYKKGQSRTLGWGKKWLILPNSNQYSNNSDILCRALYYSIDWGRIPGEIIVEHFIHLYLGQSQPHGGNFFSVASSIRSFMKTVPGLSPSKNFRECSVNSTPCLSSPLLFDLLSYSVPPPESILSFPCWAKH